MQTFNAFITTHSDPQILACVRQLELTQPCLLASFVFEFEKASNYTLKAALVAKTHKWIQGSSKVRQEISVPLKNAAYAARRSHKFEFKSILLEFDELLCVRGLTPKIVSTFEVKTKSDLILLIRFFQACHHFGYDFGE